ncbi:zinc finger protein 37 homolog [Anopheles cruzii]|uniref:zinc finger protein 37 homolog n=1 Tax=Anopheles cruzii TaxID=68878 RepID=UPI0022EC21A1|nr:zinc finger protein 37 homolog [Anopheles cruzii]
MEAIKTELIMSSTSEEIIEPSSAKSLQKCSVCLKNGQCLKPSEIKTNGKHITDVINQHLGIKLAEFELTTICQRCWMLLADFDEFYDMVNEAHRVLLETNITNVQQRPSLRDLGGEESVCAIEFVAIKQEPLEADIWTFKDKCVELNKNRLSSGMKQETNESTEQHYANSTILDEDAAVETSSLKTESTTNPEKEMFEAPVSKIDDNTKKGRDGNDIPTKLSSYRKHKIFNSGGNIKKRLKTVKQQRQEARSSKLNVDQEILNFYQRLVCTICDPAKMVTGEPLIEYANLTELNNHLRKTHGQREAVLRCPVCEKKIRSRTKIIDHKNMHLNPDQYRCEVCAEVHQNIEEHMQNKHSERTFCCDECGKKFPFKTRLMAHIRKMHLTKDVICDQCDKAFTKYSIDNHKRNVHGGVGFICEYCPRTFKGRFQLDNHMEGHVESSIPSSKVTCTVCGLVVRNKYTLVTHMQRMHMEQTPVSCQSCGKECKNKRNLYAHMRDVCTDRSFPCTICEKTFKKKKKLTEHMTTHTNTPLYQCTLCPKTFRYDTALYTHRRVSHYEQWLEIQQKRKQGVQFRLNRIAD